MIKPYQQDEVFLADVAADIGLDDFKIWWLGQSGFLLKYKTEIILLDPYLSDSLTRKYEFTDKPHKRISARVAAALDLRGVTLIASSHNHTDHLDADTLLPILVNNPQADLVIGKANAGFASEVLGLPASRLTLIQVGIPLLIRGVKITAIPAAHNELERDAEGDFKYMGFVLELGGHCVYYAGDTIYYEGLTKFLKKFKVNAALLPINGDRPERRVAGNLDGAEAAALAREIKARAAIPCHYDLFEFNTVSPDLFEETCRKLGQPFRTLLIGEGVTGAELAALEDGSSR